MSELFRAAAFGVLASLMAATSALAVEAAADPDAQQAVQLVSSGAEAKAADDPNCPSVSLAPEGDSRKAEGAKSTLDALARDCANLGAETIVKVGVVGESVRRKKGDATQVDAPMTIQIKDGDGHEVETRKINLKVEMPEGVQKVSFQHVEENVSLPPPSADGYAKWTIVVGFDPAAPGDAEVASAEEAEEAEQPEQPVARSSRSSRYSRSGRSWRSKYVRSRAYRSARSARSVRYARSTRSNRQRIEIQPAPSPVVVSAKPQQGAPAATVTTTTVNNTGSVMARAAQGFTERRDRAAQQRPAPQAQQRPAPAQAQQQRGRVAPQPTATRLAPAPAARSAQAQTRGVVRTAETN